MPGGDRARPANGRHESTLESSRPSQPVTFPRDPSSCSSEMLGRARPRPRPAPRGENGRSRSWRWEWGGEAGSACKRSQPNPRVAYTGSEDAKSDVSHLNLLGTWCEKRIVAACSPQRRCSAIDFASESTGCPLSSSGYSYSRSTSGSSLRSRTSEIRCTRLSRARGSSREFLSSKR